jgi:hypothetical protein
MTAIVRTTSRNLTHYDPDQGLKEIIVAEAAERHWKRAKDATQLYIAIEAKIRGQAAYVTWRDGVAARSQEQGGPGRGKKGVTVLRHLLPEADPGRQVVERWRKSFCKASVDGVVIPDEDKIAFELDETTKRCARLIEKEENINTIRGTEGTGEFERYTPPRYIELARKVLGTIDIDPASHRVPQKWIQAKQYFTVETDGLKRQWRGSTWLNPPYHRDLLPAFVNKLVTEIDAGRVAQAIMLTNNCTETRWFRVAMRASSSMCFHDGRISFLQPRGTEAVAMGLPTQGQVFFYYGENPERFDDVFESIGACVPRIFFARSR